MPEMPQDASAATTTREAEAGATAVEYALLIALIASAIFATVAVLGPKLEPGLQTVVSALMIVH